MIKSKIVDELHTQARKNFKRRRVIMKGIDDLWQADLVEMREYASINKAHNYLLTVIDTFSKYAWCVAVKTKNAQDITNAMTSILKLGRHPKNLQTDDGKEFFNKNFQSLMQKYKINHYSTYSVLKASIVERFNRTLKAMMWKKFSFNGNYKWLNEYKTLVSMYNNKYHRTIKMKPADVNSLNEKQILKNCYNFLKIYHPSKFKIGDYVRISRYKHIFEKGYTPNFTTEIFKVKTIQNTNPVTYILEDYQGQSIKGGFYEKELLKAHYINDYLIEKILQKKGDKIYVKWLGFSSDHNSWIKKNSIL